MDDKIKKNATGDYCGTFYAAKLFGVSVGTIQSLVEKGELEGWKTQGGHRRIAMESIRLYQAKHGLKTQLSPHKPHIEVLVVDDDASTRSAMVNQIGQWGLPVNCTAMASAMEALIDIHHLRPDILLTDLNMSGVDGLALLRTLRANAAFEGMVMVAITQLSDASIQERGGVPPNTVVVQKPVNPLWLHGFVTALVTQRQLQRQQER